jgi:L-aspartate oxidase
MSVSADFIVVGSGIAGLRAALELATAGRVLLLTKSDPEAGSTGYAQGGIAAAISRDDSVGLHVADTLAAGDGLCNPAAVYTLVDEGRRYVEQLIDWGAKFDRDASGALALAREGAHGVSRVLHAADATGREIARVLGERVTAATNVSVVPHALAVQLIVDGSHVAGVRYLDERGRLDEARASRTLLATGGAGQVYRETTNPTVATGDGVALAFWAGARVADLEFVQFHPTALAVPGQPRYLLSEALRGEGGHLVNEAGDAFMAGVEPMGDLAPRDRVSRAIVREATRTGRPVYLSMAHLKPDQVRARFPLLTTFCRRAGLDLAADRIPVSPAAHYVMGGVATDLDGRTSLAGLFAAGEVAATGAHGANRLASNSLLEGLVFGARAGAAMCRKVRSTATTDASTPHLLPAPSGPRVNLSISESAVRDAMWTSAGVFRTGDGLRQLLDRLEPAWQAVDHALAQGQSFDPSGWRLASLITVGRLIARAALRREESRGAHWRDDFPRRDDLHWTRHISEDRVSIS